MSETEKFCVGLAATIVVLGLVCILLPRQVMRFSLVFRPWVSKEVGMKNPNLLRLCGFIMIAMTLAIAFYVKKAWL